MERDDNIASITIILDPQLWSTLTKRVGALEHKYYSAIQLVDKILRCYDVDISTVVSLNRRYYVLIRSDTRSMCIWFAIIVWKHAKKLHRTRQSSIFTPDYTGYDLVRQCTKYMELIEDYNSYIPLVRDKIRSQVTTKIRYVRSTRVSAHKIHWCDV